MLFKKKVHERKHHKSKQHKFIANCGKQKKNCRDISVEQNVTSLIPHFIIYSHVIK